MATAFRSLLKVWCKSKGRRWLQWTLWSRIRSTNSEELSQKIDSLMIKVGNGVSGTSVNSRVRKELLQETRYGFCIRQIVYWTVAARRQYPNQKILATKIDYKSAYRRGILHSITALKTATQLLDNAAAIITLRLIFGGAPCPFEWWGIFSETICNLANKVLKWEDWESADLHASVQGDIPPRQSFDDNTPFAVGRELIVDIPVDPRG